MYEHRALVFSRGNHGSTQTGLDKKPRANTNAKNWHSAVDAKQHGLLTNTTSAKKTQHATQGRQSVPVWLHHCAGQTRLQIQRDTTTYKVGQNTVQ